MKQPWAYLTVKAMSTVQSIQQGAVRMGLKSRTCTTAKPHEILKSLPFLVTATPYHSKLSQVFVSTVCNLTSDVAVCKLLLQLSACMLVLGLCLTSRDRHRHFCIEISVDGCCLSGRSL